MKQLCVNYTILKLWTVMCRLIPKQLRSDFISVNQNSFVVSDPKISFYPKEK